MGGGFEGGREGERNTGAGCPAALIGGDLAATASVLLGGRARGSPPAPSSAPSAHKGGRAAPGGEVGRRWLDSRREPGRGLGAAVGLFFGGQLGEGAGLGLGGGDLCAIAHILNNLRCLHKLVGRAPRLLPPMPGPVLRRGAWRGGGLGARTAECRPWATNFLRLPKTPLADKRKRVASPTAPCSTPRTCRGWRGSGGRMPCGASAARGGSVAGWLAGRRSGGWLGGRKMFSRPPRIEKGRARIDFRG